MTDAFQLAWRQLRHQPHKLLAGLAGVAFCVVLMFMQVGFRDALFDSASGIQLHLAGDLFLLRKQSDNVALVFMSPFSRRRVQQALAVPDVQSATYIYVGVAQWKNPRTARSRGILVLGIDPAAGALELPGVREHLDTIKLENAVLFDARSRREYGPVAPVLQTGQAVPVEINSRRMQVQGLFQLGPSFATDGNLITSDVNYLRLFPGRPASEMTVGILRLKPGTDLRRPQAAVAHLLPPDVRVLTRDEFVNADDDDVPAVRRAGHAPAARRQPRRHVLTMEPAVTARNLFHAYGDGPRRMTILHDVNIEVRPGELTLITGPSGSGKTPLLTLIGALRTVQEGSLRVAGEELHGATSEVQTRVRRRVGYVFQLHNLLLFLTACENVEMALNLLPTPLPAEERRARAAEILAAVGLAEHVSDYPATLSGGEKQRVAIARALAHHPRLVLADEPTAALDKQNGHECVELMRQVAQAQGCPILIVTHDPRIQDIADRILCIDDGRIVNGSQPHRARSAVRRAGSERRNPALHCRVCYRKLLKGVPNGA